MDLTFRVHGVMATSVRRMVTHDGVEIEAQVPSLEVQLTSERPDHGSLTLNFVGAQKTAAEAVFIEGALVRLAFQAAEG